MADRPLYAYAGTGSLGYGFPEASLTAALEYDLDFIGCDAGSADPGPYYLGASESTKSYASTKRDLSLLLRAARSRDIPLLIGSAGTGGGDWGVDFFTKIVLEIAAEHDLSFSMALIYSEVSQEFVMEYFTAGKTRALGSAPELTEMAIRRSDHIVAMMGTEPYVAALEAGAQVVIAGRASDTSIFSAIPVMRGLPHGVVWHASKVIECGGAVATPKSFDGLVAEFHEDHFVVRTPNAEKSLPLRNIAAHTMYENDHPYIVHEPHGYLDTSTSTYEQIDSKTVKVTGSRFVESPEYTVKLEAAGRSGYRAGFIAGIRDDGLLSQLDYFVATVEAKSHERIQAVLGAAPGSYSIQIRQYGRNGVMGPRETTSAPVHEVGLLVDVVAQTQELADDMASLVKAQALHQHFPGRLCTAGNLAFPYSPQIFKLGPVYEFTLNHVIVLDDPMAPFRTTHLAVTPTGATEITKD